MRKHYGRWVLASALLTGSSFGTSGVAIRRSDALIVGTDSLFTSIGTSELGCKIRHDNGIYVAVAGVAYNPPTKFSAYDLALRTTHSRQPVNGAAQAFRGIAKPLLIRALENIRADYLEFYKGTVRHMAEALQVVFFGFEGKKPLYVFVYFTITDDSGKHIGVRMRYKSCPGSACPSGEGGQLFGEDKAAERTFAMTPAGVDDVETVRRMIEAEKVAHPLTVNGPTEVIVVDSKGFRWAHNDQHCD